MLVTESRFPRTMERVARCRDLTVDLETTGLRPYLGDRLFGLSIEADGEAYYFPFRHKSGTNLAPHRLVQVLDVFMDGQHILGGHNFIRFDCPMIAMEGEKYVRLVRDDSVPKWDTMIDALLANENEESFSLEALGNKYLGAAVKGHNKARLVELLRQLPGATGQTAVRSLMGRMSELLPEQVEEYACGDVLDCRALRKLYVPHHEQWGLLALAGEMYRYARLLARIQRRGLVIDRAKAEAALPRIEEERERVLAAIRQAAGLSKFNPQSPTQVMKVCGTPNAQEETLERSGHPLAQQITRYKKLGKVASTYYKGILERLDAHNVVHPQMNVTRDPTDRGGARSGRLSCSEPNFQNLVKHSTDPLFAVRGLVLARPDCSLTVNDWQRAEMWLGAHYSRDVSLWEAYHTGRDLYVELAQKAECSRQEGKIGWLMIQYGAGAWKIADFFGWPFQSVAQLEAEFDKLTPRWSDAEWRVYMEQPSVRFKREFFELVPGIKDQMRHLSEQAEANRCIRLWTGRVIHFDGARTKTFAAWNRLVQGGVGEMARIAMQRSEEVLDHYGAELLLQVHDELVVEAPDEHLRDVVREVGRTMCDFDFWLPPRVEPKVGKNYHDVTDFGVTTERKAA